jgi:RNA-directed DNA polymerase
VGGIIQGWGKHYRFCNDSETFRQLDQKLGALFKHYLGIYGEARKAVGEDKKWNLLGIESLAQIERTPFVWPALKNKQSIAAELSTAAKANRDSACAVP